jgi:hypothetical protein
MYYNCVNLIPEIKQLSVFIHYMYKLKASVGKSVISGMNGGWKACVAVVSHIVYFKFINIKSREKMYARVRCLKTCHARTYYTCNGYWELPVSAEILAANARWRNFVTARIISWPQFKVYDTCRAAGRHVTSAPICGETWEVRDDLRSQSQFPNSKIMSLVLYLTQTTYSAYSLA